MCKHVTTTITTINDTLLLVKNNQTRSLHILLDSAKEELNKALKDLQATTPRRAGANALMEIAASAFTSCSFTPMPVGATAGALKRKATEMTGVPEGEFALRRPN